MHLPVRQIGRITLALLILLVACLAAAWLVQKTFTGSPPTTENGLGSFSQPSALGERSKASGCQSTGAYPDSACTPGAVIASAGKEQICQSGYSRSVRSVSESEKAAVYAEYGIASHPTGRYEIDHFVSLELGGSNDIANLWPEPADPTPGFHEKHQVENYLHSQVCQGALPLSEAQKEISSDWLAVYRAMGGAR